MSNDILSDSTWLGSSRCVQLLTQRKSRVWSPAELHELWQDNVEGVWLNTINVGFHRVDPGDITWLDFFDTSLWSVSEVLWDETKALNDLWVIFHDWVKKFRGDQLQVVLLVQEVLTVCLKILDLGTLKLEIETDDEENDEAERNTIDNWGHFVSHSVGW